MELKECKKRLKQKAEKSNKEGYRYDAADAMFKVFILELVERVAIAVEKPKKQKRKPSAYNLFWAEKTKEGLTSTEIGKLWKDKKLGVST